MAPKLSIIIPVYKVEAYLCQCLDSVVGQTYRNLEIILIDDGSPDSCGTICDKYAAKDNRIIVFHKENEGLSAARNDGIRAATGEWIAFMDSDDWCEFDYYEQLLKVADRKKMDIICAGGYFKDYPARNRKIRVFTKFCCYKNRDQIEDLQAWITRYGLPWDKLYRTEFLKENEFCFDTDIRAFEDFLFNFQVFGKAERVALAPVLGYHYRQQSASIANGFNPRKPEINYQFISRLHDCAREYDVTEKLKKGINAATICTIAVSLNCYFFHPANKKKYYEINKEIKEMLKLPYYQQAISSQSDCYLTKRQMILKHVLRLNGGGYFFGCFIWRNRDLFSIFHHNWDNRFSYSVSLG